MEVRQVSILKNDFCSNAIWSFKRNSW